MPVSESLMQELASLQSRIQTALCVERQALVRERQEFERSAAQVQLQLEEQQWDLATKTQQLMLERHALDARASVAAEIVQDTALVFQADGGAIQTTVRTVTAGFEPNSLLAEVVRAQTLRKAEGEPLVLFVDRDASTLHWVISWLRDGAPVLAKMPVSVLQLVELEARHWQMHVLVSQVQNFLGMCVSRSSSEHTLEAEWFVAQLEQGRAPRLAICRSVTRQLRHWLAGGKDPSVGPSRRALTATHRDYQLPHALLVALEAHARDIPLLQSGLGCWLLWSAGAEGRRAIARFSRRLEKIMTEADAAVISELEDAASSASQQVCRPECLPAPDIGSEQLGTETQCVLLTEASSVKNTLEPTMDVANVRGATAQMENKSSSIQCSAPYVVEEPCCGTASAARVTISQINRTSPGSALQLATNEAPFEKNEDTSWTEGRSLLSSEMTPQTMKATHQRNGCSERMTKDLSRTTTLLRKVLNFQADLDPSF